MFVSKFERWPFYLFTCIHNTKIWKDTTTYKKTNSDCSSLISGSVLPHQKLFSYCSSFQVELKTFCTIFVNTINWKDSIHMNEWPYGILISLIKENFFQVVAISVLLYGCTTWTLMKYLEKKLDGNYTRILHWTNPGSSNC